MVAPLRNRQRNNGFMSCKGRTILDGAACEPEISDLCSMLSKMGANIEGIGSHRLEIEGATGKGCRHHVIPDRTEAATYALSAGITNGEICIEGAKIDHLGAFATVLHESGKELSIDDNKDLKVKVGPGGLKPLEVITPPYPGFPTDLQAQTTAFACLIQDLVSSPRKYTRRFGAHTRAFKNGC